MKRLFKNARIVMTDRIMNGSVLVQGNVIAAVSPYEIQTDADDVIDCKGLPHQKTEHPVLLSSEM